MPDLPALPSQPAAFLWRYVRQRPWAFGLLAMIVVQIGRAHV